MNILQELRDRKHLRDIDIYFAKNIAESFCVPEGELLFALIFNATEGGNTCLDTEKPELFEFYETYQKDIDSVLRKEMINSLIDAGVIAEAPSMNAPFIKAGNSLYMKSFYSDEKSVADFIKERALRDDQCEIDRLLKVINSYFSENSMQKAAAANAALNSLSVISGGPGTGKTTTVFSLIALMGDISGKPLKTAVCAPTGKAASRLTETITEKRNSVSGDSGAEHIPEKAVTIHRLLGMTGDSKRPVYDKDNKLPYDILVVDEASMVDVRLMAKLIDGLKSDCRLILMGDKDQLASVQPGAVLGDICLNAPVGDFTKERAELLSNISDSPLRGSGDRFSNITIMLDKSYRYKSDEGIGLLAAAAGAGDADTALDVLKKDSTGVVDFIKLDDSFESVIGTFILDHVKSYTSTDDPANAIELFNRFRILTPHRKTAGGTDHINAVALKTLFKAGINDNTKQFYNGMPVMIVQNDYGLSLFNGETGLILGQGEECRAHFADENSKTRMITPARLPDHVPAYSMTVHKSQGSEFDHVLFVLPESDSKILTRELFYTALTRARKHLTIISTEKAVYDCIRRKTERASGLFT